jgi:aspartate racemase
MKRIGLIGGMSWESSAVYYRTINEAVRRRLGGLHSADLVLGSLDFAEVVALQRADKWSEAGALLGGAGARLRAAGADFLAICTNTMHIVVDDVASHSGLPVLDIIDETASAVISGGRRRPLLLATRYTMEHGFYHRRMERHGLEVLTPDAAGRSDVHHIIFDELCRGVITPSSRDRMRDLSNNGLRAGADCVILGCTEICLLLTKGTLRCPVFDSTEIHALAAVDLALSDGLVEQMPETA